VGSVNVGDEVEGLLAVAIVFESFRDHNRAAAKYLARIIEDDRKKLTDQNRQYQC
jgi:hypothetical protein